MTMTSYLREHLSFDQAKIIVESDGHDGKTLHMKGICIQGGMRNQNQRVREEQRRPAW